MPTQAAEAILQNEMRTGRFVIRESQSCPGAFTLSVLVDGEVRHVKIRDATGGGVCLRANATDREIFHDLIDMVTTYSSTKLQLKGSIPFYLVPNSANDLSEV
jgi:fyn-related kinase